MSLSMDSRLSSASLRLTVLTVSLVWHSSSLPLAPAALSMRYLMLPPTESCSFEEKRETPLTSVFCDPRLVSKSATRFSNLLICKTSLCPATMFLESESINFMTDSCISMSTPGTLAALLVDCFDTKRESLMRHHSALISPLISSRVLDISFTVSSRALATASCTVSVTCCFSLSFWCCICCDIRIHSSTRILVKSSWYLTK
mmetsp:Transcript_68668/g.119280  ORF Transcript_68668/g.119280 Transcript_68668/m.119280 type:complete len:202 (+) Transcript_68668:764-1369(+)